MGMAISMSTVERDRAADSAARETPVHSRADEAMDRYANGDAGALETVYDEIAPVLERFLDARVDPARAPDLIAETFLLMHRTRGSFIRGSAVLPWALAIAERLASRER